MNKQEIYKEYITTKVNPVIESLVIDLLLNRPDDVVTFMQTWLKDNENKFKNIKNVEVPSVKQLKQIPNNYGELSEDDEEDFDDNLTQIIEMKLQNKGNIMRQSISAEVFGQFNQKKQFVPKVIKKTEETIKRIQELLNNCFLFNALDQGDRKILTDAFEEKTYNKGEFVVKQGDNGDVLFVVDQGELDCLKKFKPDEDAKLLKTYKQGEAFGELALLYNAPRAASIICKTKCVLFKLDRDTFNNIVKDAAIKRREQYEDLFTRIELLSTMDSFEKGQLSDSLRSQWFKKGEYVVKQGEQGDKFFFVEKGTAVAMKQMQKDQEPVEVFNYKVGDYFGELALLKAEPRQASIIATDELKVVYLDRQSFNRLLGPLNDILKRNQQKYNLYNPQN